MSYLIVNSLACLALHLLAGLILGKKAHYDPHAPLFRERSWEDGGRLYEKLGVRAWKRFLPSCGAFDKKRLTGTDPVYLRTFIEETCRAEAVHAAILASAPLFLAFNPPLGFFIVLAYLIAENLPCLIVQRYNRIRLARLLAGRS